MRNLLTATICLLSVTINAQNLKSGGKLLPEQAIMDICHYTIALNVDPETQSIDGYTETTLILSQPADKLVFDLTRVLLVKQVWVNGKSAAYEQKEDRLWITTPANLATGRQKVKILYRGKPAVAERAPWIGGFQWEKDTKGNPWIAISCQGEGAKIYFPCKDHPSDEPNEGADMIITVPKGLTVAGPGLLKKVTTRGRQSTFHWKTNYTISNYCILFNVGRYKVAKRTYTTIDGNRVPMEYYVLEENVDKAEKLLDLFQQSSRILEKYFGEYPWAKERIAASETPHLGMEHQTNIAYGNRYRYQQLGGNDFDWLLHHEYGHEWWANKVTNRDWGHMWIQEGICTYGDQLARLELAGEEEYLKSLRQIARHTENKYPIVRGDEVDSDSAYHGDIYGKGALFMHTLRFVMGDSLFFPALRKLATDPLYTYDNTVVTADVEKLFSGAYGKSLQPLFQLYLYSTDKLEIGVKQRTDDKYEIKLLNIEMALPLEVLTDSGKQKIMVDRNPVAIISRSPIQVDPSGHFLKKIIVE